MSTRRGFCVRRDGAIIWLRRPSQANGRGDGVPGWVADTFSNLQAPGSLVMDCFGDGLGPSSLTVIAHGNEERGAGDPI